jgi:hypothetical protein
MTAARTGASTRASIAQSIRRAAKLRSFIIIPLLGGAALPRPSSLTCGAEPHARSATHGLQGPLRRNADDRTRYRWAPPGSLHQPLEHPKVLVDIRTTTSAHRRLHFHSNVTSQFSRRHQQPLQPPSSGAT